MGRAAMLFSGGPAPAANAVINAAAMAFKRAGVAVLGLRDGYAPLLADAPMEEGRDFSVLHDAELQGLRNARGVLIGTARAHPGKGIRSLADLADPTRTAGLRRVWERLVALDVDSLLSIGGDGTLRTANLLARFQDGLPPGSPRVRVVHVPKTIDNDYRGIDFTFGFFTAVDTIAKELLNLRADALATSSYFIVECMGRRAGWLSYGVAVAGEAHLVVGVEDVQGALARTEVWVDPATGEEREEVRLDLDALLDHIVDLMLAREAKGKRYGTIVVAEGLVEKLPASYLETLPRDESGAYGFAKVQIGRLIAERVAARFADRTGRTKKVTGVQLGYESRCAAPHAFDVLLGAQLGVGGARALMDGRDAVMVSVSGQLEVRYLGFDELMDPETLATDVRYVRPGSDFHTLAHLLGSQGRPPRADVGR
jgi:6-phosphofructokinase